MSGTRLEAPRGGGTLPSVRSDHVCQSERMSLLTLRVPAQLGNGSIILACFMWACIRL
ncbi:unnamed protein product [Symbiodinium microadriaticum]|nr:unnamed protein product [Symbiodinium microadriaticum]